MALINRPMYEHFAARHLAVKGPGAMTTLEEGVMGVLPLDMMSDPAYWFIQGIRIFSGDMTEAAAGAGTYSKIGLSIEDASDEILVRILSARVILPDTANQDIVIYRCARTAFSSDPGVYGYSSDTRTNEAQHSQAIMVNAGSAAVPGQGLGRLVVDRHDDLADNFPMIIHPTECIFFTPNTADVEFAINLCWAEIPAYKAEL